MDGLIKLFHLLFTQETRMCVPRMYCHEKSWFTMLPFVFLSVVFLLTSSVSAQVRLGQISVRVTTDRADWTYDLGQRVKFGISVVRDGQPVPDAKVSYQCGAEMM